MQRTVTTFDEVGQGVLGVSRVVIKSLPSDAFQWLAMSLYRLQ